MNVEPKPLLAALGITDHSYIIIINHREFVTRERIKYNPGTIV